MSSTNILLAFVGSVLVVQVSSHGRLIEPPSRASMWRYGFDTPPDYNDHETYCGGFSRQWQRNNGKCGICGDAWDLRAVHRIQFLMNPRPEYPLLRKNRPKDIWMMPRAHETGGKYGNSIIVRRYKTGSIIPVHVELTANHHGYFEFRVCPMTVRGKEVNQECLDKRVLHGDNGTIRYYPGPGNRVFESHYKLPDDLTCAQCVFQWRYVAGNNWGDCGNGTGAVGCGPQEEFRACADVAIGDDEETLPPRPVTPDMGITPTRPTTKQSDISPTEPASGPEKSGPYWMFSLVIAGTCLFVVLAAMALLYSYYYHAGRAKQWLLAGKSLAPASIPIAPPRHRKHNASSAPLQI